MCRCGFYLVVMQKFVIGTNGIAVIASLCEKENVASLMVDRRESVSQRLQVSVTQALHYAPISVGRVRIISRTFLFI